ncbi:MAG: DUF1987 domain-containing protein [Bacteroidales bacterium]
MYQSVYIPATEETPDIILNPEDKRLEIAGRAYPENANYLFDPILEWIENYYQISQTEPLELIIKLEYYNSASAKKMTQILYVLDKYYKQGAKIKIKWYYKADDKILEEKAKEILQNTIIPYQILEF